ncbi:MAG: hypothetical protein RIS75_217 [Actinomycetota bacterium]
MRRLTLVTSLAALVFSFVSLSPSTAVVQTGSWCSKPGDIAISKGLKFTCVKVKTKKLWSKGIGCKTVGIKINVGKLRHTCILKNGKKVWDKGISNQLPKLECRNPNDALLTTNIRIVSPVINLTNSWDGSADAATWVSNGWYKPGLRLFEHQKPVGSTLNLKYVATDSAGKAICNQQVTLMVNKGWSGSTATMRTAQNVLITPVGCGNSCETHGGVLTGTTNNQGEVSFVLTNANTESQGGAYPDDLTQRYTGNHLFSQIAPSILGQLNDSIDIIEFQFHKSTKPVVNIMWSDEFNGAAGPLPVNSKWKTVLGDGCAAPHFNCGWGNVERQFYTSESNRLNGSGELHITLNKLTNPMSCYWTDVCTNWTSGKLWTKGTARFKYGTLEARIKVPAGIGAWPAFWMLGSNIDSTPWPASGEIDIMEAAGKDPQLLWSTLHSAKAGGGHISRGTITNTGVTLSAGFHTYGINWQPNQIDWTFDGRVVHSRSASEYGADPWPFNNYQFAILNVAVGGSFGGTPNPNLDDVAMAVDWVRYSQYEGHGSVVFD